MAQVTQETIASAFGIFGEDADGSRLFAVGPDSSGEVDTLLYVNRATNEAIENDSFTMAASVWWGGYTPDAHFVQSNQPSGSYGYFIEDSAGPVFIDKFDKDLTVFENPFWGDFVSGANYIYKPSSALILEHSNGRKYMVLGSTNGGGGVITVVDLNDESGGTSTFSPIRAYVYFKADNTRDAALYPGKTYVFADGDTIVAFIINDTDHTIEMLSFDPAGSVSPNVPTSGLKCITGVTRTTGFPSIAANANLSVGWYDGASVIVASDFSDMGFETQQGKLWRIDIASKTITHSTANNLWMFDPLDYHDQALSTSIRGGFIYLVAYDAETLLKISTTDLAVTEVDLSGWEALVPFTHLLAYGAVWPNAVNDFFVYYLDGINYTAGTSPLVRFSVPGSPIAGYLITSPCEVKAALQNLLAANFIDCVESDFTLKFVPRGVNPSVMTIPEDDLGMQADKAKLIEQTVQEQEQPRDVTVLFVDANIDYAQNKAMKARSSRAVTTKQQAVMQLPIVMTPTEARVIAERALFLAYLEGKPFSLNLWKAAYMQLDPTDVINFVYQGKTYQVRATGQGIGADFTTRLATVSEDSNAYLSSAHGADAGGIVQNVSPALADTALVLYDVPYLDDVDAIADRRLTGFYAAFSSAVESWGGAILYRSADDTTYDSVGSSSSRMVYGTVTGSPLGDPPDLWTWDEDSILEITMTNGILTGATDAEILNGANALIVGNEVIQYGYAEEITPGVFQIYHFLRGRRNTEYAAYGHGASELVIDPTTGLKRFTSPLSMIGLLRYYKGVTVGQDITTVTAETLTLAPNDLKPADPVHITGARDGGNNLTIGWTRRTRYAGDWLNNTGEVPLNEDSEGYEIDILDGVTVVRTIAWTGAYDGDGNPTEDYSAADQTTDGLTPGDPVAVKIYQISAQVGRGFPGIETV